MIPTRILHAAEDGEWEFDHVTRHRHNLRIVLERGEQTVSIRYSRWRHTSARAYRGRALSHIFRNQRQVLDFLAST